MKVRVLEERCQGHVMCVIACPEVFLLRDDDAHAYVEDEVVDARFEAQVALAARACPEQAIETFD
jgi:ferredoxin